MCGKGGIGGVEANISCGIRFMRGRLSFRRDSEQLDALLYTCIFFK